MINPQVIPYSNTGGTTCTESYTVERDGYLLHAELDAPGVSARLNIRISIGGDRWMELVEGGSGPSAEITWTGAFPVKSGQKIQMVVRSHTSTTGELKLILANKPVVAAFSEIRNRSFENVMPEYFAKSKTASGAGTIYADSSIDNHQIIEVNFPLQIQHHDESGTDTEDIRVYLTDGTNEIDLYTESAAAEDTWFTVPAVEQSADGIKYPFYIGNGWDLQTSIDAGGVDDYVKYQCPIRRLCN